MLQLEENTKITSHKFQQGSNPVIRAINVEKKRAQIGGDLDVANQAGAEATCREIKGVRVDISSSTGLK